MGGWRGVRASVCVCVCGAERWTSPGAGSGWLGASSGRRSLAPPLAQKAAAGEPWRGSPHPHALTARVTVAHASLSRYIVSHHCLSGRTCIRFTCRRDNPAFGDLMTMDGTHFKKL